MTIGSRQTHDFCWINLMSPDVDRAKAFFSQLLGWTYGEMPGVPGGELIQVGEYTAGAFMDLAGCNMPPGTPPAIGVMIKVDNADAAVARVNALGGHADPAFDVLENGRMAMCKDPNGAVFGIWEPKEQDGMNVDSRAHGAPTWFENFTPDAKRAASFYSELFGWQTEQHEPKPGEQYTVFKLGSLLIGGTMTLPPEMGNVPAHWSTKFAVRNADESARLGVELGGTQCIPVQDIPGIGRFAAFLSPQGVPFHIVEYKR